jgi:hypothetical protein
MPNPLNEAVQVSVSIDEAGPVTVSCVRRPTDGRDVLLLWDQDRRPVTGQNGKMIYGDEELRIHFIELDEADSAAVWEILREGPK